MLHGASTSPNSLEGLHDCFPLLHFFLTAQVYAQEGLLSWPRGDMKDLSSTKKGQQLLLTAARTFLKETGKKNKTKRRQGCQQKDQPPKTHNSG